MVLIQANKALNPVTLEPCYVFTETDADGVIWDMGGACMDEHARYIGELDYRPVAFATIAELQAWGRRHGYRVQAT